MTSTLLIGAGAMGSAIGIALARGGADMVLVRNSTPESSQRAVAALADAIGDRARVADGDAHADVVVLGVKPYQILDVLRRQAALLREGDLVVSLAAGVSLAALEEAAPGVAIVRAMPNTPVRVGAGAISLTRGSHVTDSQMGLLTGLLASAGEVVEVPESQIHQVIAVAGSAPAYVFYLVEAMIDAAVAQGMRRDVASRLAIQTVRGSATLLQETGVSPTVARENVTSPGGTTAKAIRVLDERAVKAAIAAAMDATADASRAMESR